MGSHNLIKKQIFQKMKALLPTLEKDIQDKIVYDYIERNALQYPHRAAFSFPTHKEYTEWEMITWKECREQVDTLAGGLISLDVNQEDVVLMMGRNRLEHHLADFAIQRAGAVPSTLYYQLKDHEIEYVVDQTQATIMMVDNPEFFLEVRKVCERNKQIKHVILMEGADQFSNVDWIMSWEGLLIRGRQYLMDSPSILSERRAKLNSESLAQLIYTSGTTGQPKGVMLTYRNVLSNCWGIDYIISGLDKQLAFLSYLPFAHVFGRLAEHYYPAFIAGHTWCLPTLLDLSKALPHVRPHIFCGVPRIWEKFYEGLMTKINASEKAVVVNKALRNAEKRLACLLEGKSVSLMVRLKHGLYDRLIFSKIRKKIGLDRAYASISGAAALSPVVQKFFLSIGVDIVEGFGLTETSPVTNVGVSDYFSLKVKKELPFKYHLHRQLGSIGFPIAGVEMKLKNDGEVVFRGPNIMKGYYKMPEETQKVIDSEGWFSSGDLGEIDDYGNLKIIGRKKEIIVTSGGKNVAPVKIESKILEHSFIEHACVVGDSKKYLTALLCLSIEGALEQWGQEQHKSMNLDQLSKDKDLITQIENHMIHVNDQLDNYETIKKFNILPVVWDIDSGELTPTLKMKRNVICEMYEAEINQMYSDKYIQSRLDNR